MAVLQELRAIREDLGKKLDTLAERVGQSATRDDLDDYVRKDVFDGLRRDLDEHEKDHDRMVEGWRGWLPIVLSAVALLWIVVGPYVHFGPR